MDKRIHVDTDETIPEDDPGWDLPAVLVLDDGRQVELPDVSIRQAGQLVSLALETGDLNGGEIDARRVRRIGPRE